MKYFSKTYNEQMVLDITETTIKKLLMMITKEDIHVTAAKGNQTNLQGAIRRGRSLKAVSLATKNCRTFLMLES